MTNAYKYAFPEEFVEKKGNDFDATIDITVENRAGSEFVLILADNGAGPGNDIDIQNSDSLGLKIVYSLVHQMKGRVEISSENGLRFKITFQDQR
jgi:two-component sensor histidine kinase